MKVTIIGGGGLVGSMTAYALQLGGVVSRICVVDANKDLALGQAAHRWAADDLGLGTCSSCPRSD